MKSHKKKAIKMYGGQDQAFVQAYSKACEVLNKPVSTPPKRQYSKYKREYGMAYTFGRNA